MATEEVDFGRSFEKELEEEKNMEKKLFSRRVMTIQMRSCKTGKV